MIALRISFWGGLVAMAILNHFGIAGWTPLTLVAFFAIIAWGLYHIKEDQK